MWNKKLSRDPEIKKRRDAGTGRSIWQITDSDLESKHAYYDICPWDRTGKYLVFSSTHPNSLTIKYRDVWSTQRAKICIADTETWEIQTIADNAFYIAHVGAYPLWHPLKRRIFFRRSPDRIGVIDPNQDSERTVEGRLRQLSPDGTTFVLTTNELDQDGTSGVYTMQEDGSDCHCIIPLEQLYELTPNRDKFHLDDMTIGSTKWTPDGQHFLIAMWVYPKPHVRRSIYVAGRDGSSVRWLAFFGHHHSWTPDGNHVLFNDWKITDDHGTRKETRMHFIDFDGSNRHIVIDEPIGWHPIMSPDARSIADWDHKGMYLVHIDQQRVERLVEFRQRFDMSNQGTHPHCVWNRDGTQLLYNSAETGHSEIYLIPMED